jgi:hypothetical protein
LPGVSPWVLGVDGAVTAPLLLVETGMFPAAAIDFKEEEGEVFLGGLGFFLGFVMITKS